MVASSSPSAYRLQRGPPVQNIRRKKRRPNTVPDVLLHNGLTLFQPHLPRNAIPPSTPQSDASSRNTHTPASASSASDATDVLEAEPPSTDHAHLTFLDEEPKKSSYRRKRIAQSVRWQQEVLPQLLPVFAALLQETKSLRTLHSQPQIPRHSACDCRITNIRVTIVRWSSLEDVKLAVCACTTAPVQLMRLGAFGCSPVHPTLAVDLHVLEFCMQLFLQISPNTTAISMTLERVLAQMGFQLEHENTLRRRFGNCLEWYTHLKNLLKDSYSKKIEAARDEVVGPREGVVPETPRGRTADRSSRRSPSSSGTPTPRGRRRSPASSPPDTPTPANPNAKRRCSRSPSPSPDTSPFGDVPPLLRPSEYLRERCPACFGALKHDPSAKVDVKVCGDACFGHKNKKSKKDPFKRFPKSLFIPEEIAARTEAYVDALRFGRKTTRPRKRAKQREEDPDAVDDDYESERQRLPRSVLDACEASFKAADERRVKASTKFFDDTALMALVCSHDRVLFVTNMHSAGEKQFYMIALLETLFQHLPRDIRVGFLYDVACIFERSCVKWGFLDRYMDRLEFAVSVFHAFGHEWACQLLYHPRKREGFGFTNGEGCERFWKSLKHLVAHLRITGYHNRLYTLDAQITHNDEAALFRLGKLFRRHHQQTITKRAEATKKLQDCGKPEAELREQYALQIRAQTKPLPRRKKTSGEQFINSILMQRSAVQARQTRVDELLKEFETAAAADDANAPLLQIQLGEAREALEKAKSALSRKEGSLTFATMQELQKLARSDFMRENLNAHALKLRTKAKLRARKFELDAVERSFRRLQSDTKLHAHTESAVKRREPTISKLAAQYNKACQRIAKLIRDGKAPPNARAPPEIPPGGLWKLDVDDVIFQDVELDQDEDAGPPPPWLADDKVREGIKALLERDRCEETDARLLREKIAVREWFAEEWAVAGRAVESAESTVDKYHLQLHQDKLLRLCVTWDKDFPDLGEDKTKLRPWGPSAVELAECRARAHRPARGEKESEEDEEETEELEEAEEEDYEVLEALERADSYRNEDEEEDPRVVNNLFYLPD
ncbi:hypothetical protein R3P38DRAFT_2589614 [Favolaschia claudopus]|uniref:CxC1-like cysteine cluster associated with KDZ transposases domain-containing protein n=1 Tax=Favolaschia claudopus TaxID=2862362 RepID=A0AAV9Z1N3_9AGAR